MTVLHKLGVPFALLIGLTSGSQAPTTPDPVAPPGTLSMEEIRSALGDPQAHVPYTPDLPLGLTPGTEAFSSARNPLTRAVVELGRQLYFDGRLSRDGTVSCASCHDPAKGWTDNLAVSTGIDGKTGTRSAPTVINRAVGLTQFWDGRAATLEEQALGPIGNPVEMGFSVEEAVERLSQIPGYRMQFDAVFGRATGDVVEANAGQSITPERIAWALAAFERTILSGASKNDYYEQAYTFFEWEPDDDEDPAFIAKVNRVLDLEKEHRMSESAERGRALFFGKASCSVCHVGQDLTDEQFHNIGVGFDRPEPDLGRFAVTGADADRGAFKTPTVRNIALTAPYMHDGSLATLMEVVEHYDQGGIENPTLSDKVFPLGLTGDERQDLVQFMEEALTGTITEVAIPRLP